jgi:hypothetical protein
MQEPTHIIEESETSSWAETPLVHVDRLCLSFLQGLFSKAPKGHFHWNADDKDTDINITLDSPVETDVVNKRPTIVAVRAPVGFAGIALDQFQTMDLHTGTRTHTDLISGHMTFNCLTRRVLTGETLSWLVARHLWILRRLMLQRGFHDFGQRIQIGAPSPPGAIISGAVESEIVNVAVVVPFSFQWTDVITPLGFSLLQELEATITMPPVAVHTMPTQTAEGGSPGPGLRGTATGARNSNRVGIRKPRPGYESTVQPLDQRQPVARDSLVSKVKT